MTRKHAIKSGKAGSAEKTVKDIRNTSRMIDVGGI